MMKILMVHPHDIFSPHEPWTRRIRSFARQFSGSGHQVKLVYFPVRGARPQERFFQGYEIIPFDRTISPVVFLKNVKILHHLADWADVVHFQKCHHYAAMPAVIAAYMRGKPLHYDWDDWEEMIWYESCGRGLRSRFIAFSYYLLERWLPVLSDTVSVASNYLKELALQRGAQEKSLCLAPVGVDLEGFNPRISGEDVKKKYRIKTPLILYLGQLHGAQYIDLLIRAMEIVLQEEKATLMIVGTGSMQCALEELARTLGIEKNVIFTGSVPYDQVPEYIAAADICAAIFKETKVTRCKSPLKIVEYMAMGKAIVASDIGETRNMLGEAGILVAPGSIASFASGILKLLQETPLRKELGCRARNKAEQEHSWSFSAQKLLSIYESF